MRLKKEAQFRSLKTLLYTIVVWVFKCYFDVVFLLFIFLCLCFWIYCGVFVFSLGLFVSFCIFTQSCSSRFFLYCESWCDIGEFHCYFYCERCNKTYYLEKNNMPNILFPDGFIARTISYVIKGICANCINI